MLETVTLNKQANESSVVSFSGRELVYKALGLIPSTSNTRQNHLNKQINRDVFTFLLTDGIYFIKDDTDGSIWEPVPHFIKYR